ncbi:hypothetical protein Tco_1383419 [Tanacetum coccineum]
MKAAYYPDVGLEQMVPDQMWIEEECKYDIAAIVVRIEVFSVYGYDYMKKIVLRRADLKEHIIAERDFKYLYSSDFKDLQRVEDFQLGIESYQTQLNLTKPRWDATGFEYKHNFTIDEALDYRVKEFKVNRMNPGLNTRFWSTKDVDRTRSSCLPFRNGLRQGGSSVTWKGSRKDGDGDTSFRNSDENYHDPEKCEHEGLNVTTSQEGNTPQQGGLRYLL